MFLEACGFKNVLHNWKAPSLHRFSVGKLSADKKSKKSFDFTYDEDLTTFFKCLLFVQPYCKASSLMIVVSMLL